MGAERRSPYKSEADRQALLSLYDRVLAKWPLPFEERFLESRFGRTHVLACGAERGEAVLFFHGTGNNSLSWRPICDALGRRFRLYLVDSLNDPGKSERSPEFSAPRDYAEWTAGVLDGLGLPKARVVGHSKGGWLALNAAIALPERVGKLVLLAPAVGINEKLKFSFLLKSIKLGLNPSPRNVEAYFRYMSPPGKAPNRAYLEYALALLKGAAPDMDVKHRRFSDGELSSIQAPTIMLFGEHEVCNDFRAVIDRAKALMPRLECRVLPDAGHGLQGDDPELVGRIVAEFLG